MSPRVQEHGFGGTTEQQIEQLKIYATRQGESITHIGREQVEMKERLFQLEEAHRLRLITEAREEERDKRLDDRLLAMTAETKACMEQVKALKQLGGKALWVFIGAVLLAAARWLIEGGLANVQ